MFDAEYFKELLNETTALIANKSERNDTDSEAEVRIESNIAALKYLSRAITDEELRRKTLERIDLLCLEPEDFEMSTLQSRDRIVEIKRSDEHSGRIERDILRYSKDLHVKAKRLLDSLELDDKVLGDVTDRMSKNLIGTSSTLKSLKRNGYQIPLFRTLVTALIVFVAMYFVIRFL